MMPQMANVVAVALACAALSPAVVTADCDTAPFGSCGSNTGTTCCPDAFYCQPWDAGFFQCLPVPETCGQQLTNMDLVGNDIKTIYGIQPSECCTQCSETDECVAYTFVNSNPGQPACYLKSGVGEQVPSIGAVSGIVGDAAPTESPEPTESPAPSSSDGSGSAETPEPTETPEPSSTETPGPEPTSDCSAEPFSACGNSSGVSCCPENHFCQPWSPDYYQCVPTPVKCSSQATDADYVGNDIKSVSVNLPELCCDECAKTEGCKAYTFINGAAGQPVCYLKSEAGEPVTLIGAVAGRLD